MLNVLRLSALAAMFSAAAFAQAPAAAKPANATGQCKDGSYSTAASKAGACRGHNGVKDWYATTAVPPATAAVPAKPGSAPVPPPAPPTANKATPPAPTVKAAPAPAAAQAPAPTATGAPSPKPTAARGPKGNLAGTPVAPGGGPGMVWVNTSSNVYHCPGTDFYGKTKAGAYMSEAAAKAKGARPDHGNACTK